MIPAGVCKGVLPKVEGTAFPGAALIDLADIEPPASFEVEETQRKPLECRSPRMPVRENGAPAVLFQR